jgi:hypothetical protein
MSTSKLYINHYNWATVWGRYCLPHDLGVLIMFKRSMFVVGCEIFKSGGMIFLGPLAVGIGKILEEKNDAGL